MNCVSENRLCRQREKEMTANREQTAASRSLGDTDTDNTWSQGDHVWQADSEWKDVAEGGQTHLRSRPVKSKRREQQWGDEE